MSSRTSLPSRGSRTPPSPLFLNPSEGDVSTTTEESWKRDLETQMGTVIDDMMEKPPFIAAVLQRQSQYKRYLEVSDKTRLDTANFFKDKTQSHKSQQQIKSGLGGNSSLYSPCHDAHEARVFQVYPGRSKDPISGELHHVFLDFECKPQRVGSGHELHTPPTQFAVSKRNGRPIHYTALSYVWGDPKFDCVVLLNGGRKCITRSLSNAIRRLRHQTESVMLWIDQIAIDQDDPSDKAHQVRLMGSIYRRAYNTVIWLGDESEHGAFVALYEIRIRWGGPDNSKLPEASRISEKAPVDQRQMRSLTALFANPWFSRTWTIQEAILSDQPWLMSGSSTIHWNDFVGHCGRLANRGMFADVPPPSDKNMLSATVGMDVAADLSDMKTSYRSSPSKKSLLDALADTRYAKASNPLDKVYAVLGFCEHLDVKPDYRISYQDLFTMVSLKTLDSVLVQLSTQHYHRSPRQDNLHQDLYRLFCCVDHQPRHCDGLPSWVPDWTKLRSTTSLGFSKRVWYRAGSPQLAPNALRINKDQRSLTLMAATCGIITDLSPTVSNARTELTASTDCQVGLKICMDFADKRPPATSPIPFATFCHTLVAGRTHDGRDKLYSKHKGEYLEALGVLCDDLSQECAAVEKDARAERQTWMSMSRQEVRKPTHGKMYQMYGRMFQNLREAFSAAVLNRRLCRLDGSNRLALVPRYAQIADLIAVFPGCNVPFVLRSVGRKNQFELIGECYVYDLMDGEHFARRTTPLEPVVLI